MGVSKGVDVTPERVAARYTEVGTEVGAGGRPAGRNKRGFAPATCRALPHRVCQECQEPSYPLLPAPCPLQVYLLLQELLSSGLSGLPPAFVHASATDERLLVLPASAADAARRLKRFARGGRASVFAGKKGGEEGAGTGAGADPTPPPVPETPSSRGGQQFAAADADPLGAVAFDIPADALPPPPARAAAARRAPALAAPQRPTPPPPAFKGAVQDDAVAAAPPDAEGFGAFGAVELMGEWAALQAGGCVQAGW